MIVNTLPDDEQLLDLLVTRVTEGLSAEQAAELEQQLDAQQGVDADCLEHAAAAAAVVFARAERQPQRMPQGLKDRIMQQAQVGPGAPGGADVVYLQDRREQTRQASEPARRPWLSGAAIGWYAAAALALVLVLPGPAPGPLPTRSLLEQRAALLAKSTDAITVPWMTSEQPGYEQVSGDVVWSDAAQQGFLRLAGLPANQPTVAQYQLWIIDPDRDDQPVDGGVFDVAPGAEVLVPIDAKLAVTAPKAFALTLEQPGGVVVSDGPLLVVAAFGPRPG